MARTLALSSPTSALSWLKNDEGALKRTHSDRRQSQSRKHDGSCKINGVSVTQENALERPYFQDSAASRKAQLEVETLLQKIQHLCIERRSIKRETASIDQSYANIIRNLKAELETAQLQYSEMRSEQVWLQQKLFGVDEQHTVDCEQLRTLHQDGTIQLNASIHELEASCRVYANRLSAIQAELLDHGRKLQLLGSEQEAFEAEASSVEGATTAARLELDGLQQRVRQSEAETMELQNKCAMVGERFERVLDVSEKENHERVEEIKAKIRSFRHKAEKQQRSADELKERLVAAKTAQAHKSGLLGERAASAQRLRDACQAERETSMKREQQYFDGQRKSLQDQATELRRRSGMIPLAMHNKMLCEQGEWFANAIRELEEVLRHQQRSQEKEKERMAEQREQERELKEREMERERRRRMEAMEQERVAEERLRVELLEEETMQEEAATKCQKLEEELKDAQASLAQTEASAAAVEEQRHGLAKSLEAASARLSQLRGTLETERATKLRAQGSLTEARRRLEASQRAAASASAQLGSHDELRESWRRMEASWTAQQRQEAGLTTILSELQNKSGALQVEVDELHEERQRLETKLRSTQEMRQQLEKQQATDVLAARRRQEENIRMKCLFAGHANRSRRAATELKRKIQSEQDALLSDLQGRMHHWGREFTRDQNRVSAMQQHSRKVADAACKSSEGMVARLEALRASNEHLLKKIDSSVSSLSALHDSSERCQNAMQVSATDSENIIKCIASALPDGTSPSTARSLLSFSFKPHESLASPEMLAALGDAVQNGLDAVKSSVLDVERRQWKEKLSQFRFDNEVAVAARLAQLTEKRSELECSLRILESESRTFQEQGQARKEQDKTLCASEQFSATLTEQLSRANEERRAAAKNIQNIESELEESRVQAINLEEEARNEARRPLERELHEVRSQFDVLHERLKSDTGQHRAAWEQRLQTIEHDCELTWHKAEARLHAEVHDLQRELSEAPGWSREASALRASESCISTLREELSASRSETQDAISCVVSLQEELTATFIATDHHREILEEVQRQISKTSDTRRHDAFESREAARIATRTHSIALTKMRQQIRTESLALKAGARNSLGNLNRRIAAAEGDAALQEHVELMTRAEHLAERARSSLAT